MVIQIEGDNYSWSTDDYLSYPDGYRCVESTVGNENENENDRVPGFVQQTPEPLQLPSPSVGTSSSAASSSSVSLTSGASPTPFPSTSSQPTHHQGATAELDISDNTPRINSLPSTQPSSFLTTPPRSLTDEHLKQGARSITDAKNGRGIGSSRDHSGSITDPNDAKDDC